MGCRAGTYTTYTLTNHTHNTTQPIPPSATLHKCFPPHTHTHTHTLAQALEEVKMLCMESEGSCLCCIVIDGGDELYISGDVWMFCGACLASVCVCESVLRC